MSEASLWDYLRQGILPAKGHYSRIESETAQGFPDVHYTLKGQSGTIELKCARLTGHKPTSKPFFGKDQGLRKSQVIWMAEEDAAFGRVWICAQVDDKIFLLDGNVYASDFNELTLSELERISEVVWVRGKDYPTKLLEDALSESL
jgi:hypothetical protein